MVAIDSGASSNSNYDGVTYEADKYYLGGELSSTTDGISGASDGTIFQTERYGAYRYDIPVTGNGSATIVLHFAEIFLNASGERNFSVNVEGQGRINSLDLYATAGHDRAHTVVIDNVQVNDGSVTIETITGVENPTIAALAVYSNALRLDLSQPTEPEPPVTPVNGKKFVGNITTNGSIRSDFLQYWNQITPENGGKWRYVEPNRDQYNWSGMDEMYQFTRQNNIPMKAHVLVWGQQYPSWIDNLSASEQAGEIEEWIRDFCNRYPGIEIIDVVNEAIDSHAPANYARNAFGSNWVLKSFQLARQYCPNAILVYNDYNFMTWNTDEIMDLIRPSVQAGVVDALGLQAHSLYDPKVWSAQEIKDKLDHISSLGVPLYVSEYDIEATNDQTQLQYMQMHFPVFWNHPNVIGITFWGYVYGTTWREGTGLIRSNGQHRPAMDWLMDYIQNN